MLPELSWLWPLSLLALGFIGGKGAKGSSPTTTQSKVLANQATQIGADIQSVADTYSTAINQILAGNYSGVPGIAKSVEGTKFALSNTLKDLESGMARRNITGPYAPAALGEVQRQGEFAISKLPTDLALNFLGISNQGMAAPASGLASTAGAANTIQDTFARILAAQYGAQGQQFQTSLGTGGSIGSGGAGAGSLAAV